ncbi:MAG: TAXI family TRAP transporter solute-binding subunit [Pseudomonadota bacterium]
MKKLLIAALAAFAIGTSGAAHAQDADYVLNTASTGGTYHPVGTAIATLSKIKLLPKQKFSLTAVNSAGSAANVQDLASGSADFAILQGLFGSYAATGTGPVSEPQENLRAVTMLWQNVEQFVMAKDMATTGTAADLVTLEGKAVGMGRSNSGTLGSNTVLLAGLGVDVGAMDNFDGGYGPTADQLANGGIIAAGIPSGPPTGAITRLMASNGDDFVILDVTDEERAKMDGGRNLWVPYTIEAGTYPGQDKDVNTIAQSNFLAVNASVDEEHVYQLTKTMYENLDFLTAIHPATRAMSIEVALAGLPVPLHPGAARYYKEVGVEIPDALMAK